MITLKAEFFAEFFSRFLLQIVKLNSAKVIEIGSVAKICPATPRFLETSQNCLWIIYTQKRRFYHDNVLDESDCRILRSLISLEEINECH